MLRMMDNIGYNAVVVGNHDFITGPVELANTIQRASPRFPVLGANKDFSQVPDGGRLGNLMKDYVVLNTANGVRVAVVGLLTDEFMFFEYFKPAKITDLISKATQITQKIRNENLADVIVLLSHNEFNTNLWLARAVPWVNVVISGHAHVKRAYPEVVTNAGEPVYVVEAKSWGQFLGDMTLTVDKEKKIVRLKDYALRPVSPDIPEDPQMVAMVDEQDRFLNSKYGGDVRHDHVAQCESEMPRDDYRETAFGNLLADAYRFQTGADLGLDSSKLIGFGFSPGSLSTMDMNNALPHIYDPKTQKAWTLKIVNMRGAELRMVLNFVMLANKYGMSLGWVNVSGARIYYTSADAVNPLRQVEVFNPFLQRYEPMNDAKVYKLALHDGLLMSLRLMKEKFFVNINLSDVSDSGLEAWQAVKNFTRMKASIRALDYEAKDRYFTLDADLGVHNHSIVYEKNMNRLRIPVRNYGRKASLGETVLRVFRGLPNDPINDETPGNEKYLVWQLNVPALQPGEQRDFYMNWPQLPLGIFSLKTELVSKDENTINNTAYLHINTK